MFSFPVILYNYLISYAYIKEITPNYSNILGAMTNKHANLQSETFLKKSLQKVKKRKVFAAEQKLFLLIILSVFLGY
jgi:hypothetical protein